MADRYRTYPSSGRPASSYGPATTSVPTSIGYASVYADDIYLPSSSTSATPSSSRHHLTSPRGYYTSTNNGVPTTTRTYAVNHDPRSRPSRESSRTRRSTLDSAPRPPVIVTTSHKDRSNAPSSHSSGRTSSPLRDDHHGSSHYHHSSPSSHSRHHGRTSSANFDHHDYSRPREGSLSARDAEAYRNSRPSVVYSSDPRHSSAGVDYANNDFGADGFQYTNAGELARYDLDHPKSRRRRDSMDRGYHRPHVAYNPDQRSLNVGSTGDVARGYTSNTSRPYDGRGGPPPTTRGFDRINQGYDYEPPRDGPSAAPVPPSPRSGSGFEVAHGAGRRSRPNSMYQDGPSRPGHYDEYYRSRDESRNGRELRDRDRDAERSQPSPNFNDDSVATRGFGIRPASTDPYEQRRRQPRRDESTKRSDESLKRDSDNERRERHHEHHGSSDNRRDRRENRSGSDDEEKERTRLRDKLAGGLGIAAAAVGLGGLAKDDEKKDDDKEAKHKRRDSPSAEEKKPREDVPRESPRVSDNDLRERGQEQDRRPSDEELYRRRDAAEADSKERSRRDAESRLTGEPAPAASTSDSDEGRSGRRRQRASRSFNPNDASDISKLKEQLAAMKTSDKDEAREERGHGYDERRDERTGSQERTRSNTPPKDLALVEHRSDDERGRELSVGPDGKHVRLVSPPRDKRNDKPVRGILKQATPKFPEEANPIREGVAPHKEDKKLKEVPAGARWTKIARKKVNPEALEVGKERYEIRDDFVIVLRVLSKEEIQAYATATQILRERRRNKDREGRDYGDERGDKDDEEPRKHRHRHTHSDEDEKDRERDRDSDRRRRHRRDADDDYEGDQRTKDSESGHHSSHHHRSFRERDRDRRDRDWDGDRERERERDRAVDA